MKRLFKVCTNKSNKPIEHGGNPSKLYFSNKMDAKVFRDSLGGPDKGFRVAKGPDHIGKHSGFGVARMRRQPKRSEV